MVEKKEKFKEIKEKVLDKEKKELKQRVSIIFDGKQYNIRIPKNYAEKAEINPETDEFEFTLEISEDRTELPMLYGELVEKEDIS